MIRFTIGGKLDYTDKVEQRQTDSLGRCIVHERHAKIDQKSERRGKAET
jgi:hypothetical protein